MLRSKPGTLQSSNTMTPHSPVAALTGVPQAPEHRYGDIPPLFGPGLAAIRLGQAGLAAPFEAARLHYAGAVLAGLVPRSLLASARLERALDAAEKLCLGALARRR